MHHQIYYCKNTTMQPIITNSFNLTRLEPMAMQFHEQRNKTSLDRFNFCLLTLLPFLSIFKFQSMFWLKSPWYVWYDEKLSVLEDTYIKGQKLKWTFLLLHYKNKYEKRTLWLYAIIWKWQIRFRYTSCTHWHCSIAVLQCFRHANAKMNCRYWNFFQPGNCITYALCYVINTYTGCLTPKIQ